MLFYRRRYRRVKIFRSGNFVLAFVQFPSNEVSFVALMFGVSMICHAQEHYSFVFLYKKSDAALLPKEQLDKIMEGHMSNINRLAKESKLKTADPFEGGGEFIF